jgi:hypothetical protein
MLDDGADHKAEFDPHFRRPPKKAVGKKYKAPIDSGKVMELVAEGGKVEAIAAELNIGETTVYRILKANLPGPPEPTEVRRALRVLTDFKNFWGDEAIITQDPYGNFAIRFLIEAAS